MLKARDLPWSGPKIHASILCPSEKWKDKISYPTTRVLCPYSLYIRSTHLTLKSKKNSKTRQLTRVCLEIYRNTHRDVSLQKKKEQERCTYPAAKTLPSVEKAQQRPLLKGATCTGQSSSILQNRTILEGK